MKWSKAEEKALDILANENLAQQDKILQLKELDIDWKDFYTRVQLAAWIDKTMRDMMNYRYSEES